MDRQEVHVTDSFFESPRNIVMRIGKYNLKLLISA